MNFLSQAMLTALMLRFGFLEHGRGPIDAAWAAILKAHDGDVLKATDYVDGRVATALEALPEGAPTDLMGSTIAGLIASICAEHDSVVVLPSDSTKHADLAEGDNRLFQHLVASWRARTSDELGEVNEDEWWQLLVGQFGDEQRAETVVALTVRDAGVAVVRDTGESEAKHMRRMGHEIVRALLRLVDSVRTRGEAS